MIFVGIDPGLSGAIAAIKENGKLFEEGVWDTPVLAVERAATARSRKLAAAKGEKAKKGHKNTYVESAMADLLETIRVKAPTPVLVTIENQHARPGSAAGAVMNTGIGFGLWIGICAGQRLVFQKIEPGKWKREMGLETGADKNASIILAARLFPTASLSRKKDDGRAEALLIAEWARRNRKTGF